MIVFLLIYVPHNGVCYKSRFVLCDNSWINCNLKKMKKYILFLILFGLVLACNTSQVKDESHKNGIAIEELDITHLNTTDEVSSPILDSSANPKQNFFEKHAETAWTNGLDTIEFKPFTDEIKDWGDVIGPKMWYLYKVDGPFYILPCEDCYTGNECHMCGYNALTIFDTAIELYWDYQNDFFAESQGVKFYEKEEGYLASIIIRNGYFEQYESNEIKWIRLSSDQSISEKEVVANKNAIEEFEHKKELEMQEVEKELFDNY